MIYESFLQNPLYFITLFFSIVVTIAAVIIGLDCIWRTKHKLDTFLKLMVVGVAISGLYKILEVFLGFNFTESPSIGLFLETIASLFFLLGFIEMYRIIRVLDNEKTE